MTETASTNETLQLAFALAPVGLCVSRDRVVDLCNEAFARMFGYEAGELQGRPLAPLYPSLEEFEDIGNLGLPVMRESGMYSDERIMRRKDGTLFWCHVAGRALDRSDPFGCAVWMFEDISARRPVRATLTAREREIAQQLVAGATSKQIARALAISPRTVEAHRARLMRKFDAATAGELVARLVGAG
ncbi:LuxR C-terminal-related transcriptional regulator [Ramlibacter sp. XY19]|uniref:LuxR C-terminal-related transcriptional regulator n=1 Tax=Ramlibacter paludis TaxID=2908000 RepID=UPI0023DCB6A6|nr:LuxR C-terminal-related transcriptional regulator [Ramlibacter paludis]MCG2594880.1 LuxR C-terminal-related transcriptional regulator [Ramlibacter paludis]